MHVHIGLARVGVGGQESRLHLAAAGHPRALEVAMQDVVAGIAAVAVDVIPLRTEGLAVVSGLRGTALDIQ